MDICICLCLCCVCVCVCVCVCLFVCLFVCSCLGDNLYFSIRIGDFIHFWYLTYNNAQNLNRRDATVRGKEIEMISRSAYTFILPLSVFIRPQCWTYTLRDLQHKCLLEEPQTANHNTKQIHKGGPHACWENHGLRIITLNSYSRAGLMPVEGTTDCGS